MSGDIENRSSQHLSSNQIICRQQLKRLHMFAKPNVVSLVLVLTFISSCNSFKNIATSRTPGAVIDDGFIQRIAHRQIRRLESEINPGNISAHCFNRSVLLTGQVESPATAELVESAVRKIRVVKHIHNEITVSGPTSLTVRASDTLIATKVRSKLLATQNVHVSRFKVVTNNGVVFLMGLVSRDEANRAVNSIRTVFGAQKIVKILEYID